MQGQKHCQYDYTPAKGIRKAQAQYSTKATHSRNELLQELQVQVMGGDDGFQHIPIQGSCCPNCAEQESGVGNSAQGKSEAMISKP